MAKGEKQIHIRIDKNSKLTLKDVLKTIKEIQSSNPDLDVFFDGDEYAICSRPRKKDKAIAGASPKGAK